MKETDTGIGTPEKLVRRGNMVTICKPEGTYTVVYGRHDRARKEQEQYPANIDSVCFEWSSTKHPSNSDEIEKVTSSLMNQKPAFDFALQHNLPLFAVDCSISGLVNIPESVGFTIEPILGLSLYTRMMDALGMLDGRGIKIPMTRREFLKTVPATLVVLYSTVPLFTRTLEMMSYGFEIGEEKMLELDKATKRIHPELELFTLGLRNVAAAQKMQYLLKRDSKHLLTTWGYGHVGIEEAILDNENDRLEFLSRFKPLVKTAIPHPETLFQITEYRASNHGRWHVAQILEEPGLKSTLGQY